MIPSSEILALAKIAHQAGAAIMDIYHSDFQTTMKSDQSPVTAADEEAEAIILAGLAKLPNPLPVIAEEQMARGLKTKIDQNFFLVDPLDGTKEFISRNGEFTVNIAKIENGTPTGGVVYAPALGELFVGEKGQGAYCATLQFDQKFSTAHFIPIKTRNLPYAGATVLASRSHMDDETEKFIATFKVEKCITAGSSLKFCRIAQGQADLYPRFGRTMEWDTAAGHAVLAAAGGTVTTPDHQPFVYGKAELGFANGAFIAQGLT